MSISSRPLVAHTRLSTLLTAVAALSFYGCGGDDLTCGGPFCVTPGPPQATRLRAGLGNGQTGAPGRELPLPLEAIVTDDDDRPIQDVEIRFSVGQGGGSLSHSEIRSDIDGRVQVSWTLGAEPGAQSVQAAATSSTGSQLAGSPISFSAQAVRPPPARLAIRLGPPELARHGIPFEQQPVIEVLDADDQPVPQVQVTASIASGGGTLSGASIITSDAAGQAAYNDLAILGAKGPRTIQFTVTDPALEVASGTVELGAGAPAEITGVEPLAYAGAVSSPVSPAPSVVVKDAAGNGVPGVAVTFTADRTASVSPETATTNDLGVAQVTSWTLGTTANVQYSLTARLEGFAFPPVRFTAMARAGPAGRLTIVVQPSSPTQSGTPFAQQPVIQIVDRNGNPTPQPDVLITATVSSGPPGTVQNASATTDGSGRATFSGLTLSGVVGNYTISFSAEGLTGATSNPISITTGVPAKLALATAPSPTARSRVPLTVQPIVQVQDASGNPVAQAGIQIGASVAAGGGTLSGETATSDAAGRANFAALAIIGGPGAKTLSFSSPGLAAVSAEVTLPGVSSIAVQTPAPGSLVVGGQVSNAPSWILIDAAGQPVPDVSVMISASGGSVAPTSAVSDVNGVVLVQTWTVGTTAGDQYVELRVEGTDLSSQAHVQTLPAGPAQLQKISGDNPVQSGPVNDTLPDLFVVQLLDQYGNGIDSVLVDWQTCDGTPGFVDTTSVGGYSSAAQPTGPTPGTFCTRASTSGFSVEFTYTVTAAATAGTELRTTERSVLMPKAPAPVAPRRRSTVRP